MDQTEQQTLRETLEGLDGNFNSFDEQERSFESFYKPNTADSKIKQRLWIGVAELTGGQTGKEKFRALSKNKIVKWAAGQIEIGPGPGRRILRVAFMTYKQYSVRRVKSLILMTSIRAGASIRGAVTLATDFTRRFRGTEIFEHGDCPQPATRDNDDSDESDDSDDEELGRNDILEEALKFDNVCSAMNYIKHKDRLWYISSQKQIRHFIEGEIVDRTNRAVYEATQFNEPLLDLHDDTHKNKAIVLIGPTGLGKTQWALAHFKNPVHVRDKNDYSRITDNTDGLVLDDLDQMHWQPLTLLKLVECETNVTMNIKYGSKIIRAGMPRIIIANSWELFWPQNFKPESIDATERRVVAYVIKLKLFGETTNGRAIVRMPKTNFIFTANNIGVLAELNKFKRENKLKEMEADETRRKYQCLSLVNTLAVTGSADSAAAGTRPSGLAAPHPALGSDQADEPVSPVGLPPPIQTTGVDGCVASLADNGPADV